MSAECGRCLGTGRPLAQDGHGHVRDRLCECEEGRKIAALAAEIEAAMETTGYAAFDRDGRRIA